MGSSRRRHSTGRKAGSSHARKGAHKTTRPKPVPQPKPDVDAILGGLSDSLSIIATATNALVHAQQASGTVQDVSDEITTLEHGLRALRSAYSQMDVALLAVRP